MVQRIYHQRPKWDILPLFKQRLKAGQRLIDRARDFHCTYGRKYIYKQINIQMILISIRNVEVYAQINNQYNSITDVFYKNKQLSLF